MKVVIVGHLPVFGCPPCRFRRVAGTSWTVEWTNACHRGNFLAVPGDFGHEDGLWVRIVPWRLLLLVVGFLRMAPRMMAPNCQIWLKKLFCQMAHISPPFSEWSTRTRAEFSDHNATTFANKSHSSKLGCTAKTTRLCSWWQKISAMKNPCHMRLNIPGLPLDLFISGEKS